MSNITYNFSPEDLIQTDNYADLRAKLARINAKVSEGSYIFDPDKSELVRHKELFREKPQNQGNQKCFYGIVLERRDSTKLTNIVEVFVDVPGFNQKPIDHPDLFASTNIDLNYFEDLIYYHIDTYQSRDPSMPIEGGICVVEVSEHYPNHREVDKYGNKYLGMIAPEPIITISKNTERLKFGPSGIGVVGGYGAYGYGGVYAGAVGNIPANFDNEDSQALVDSLNLTDLQSFNNRTRKRGYISAGKLGFVRSQNNISEEDKRCILEAAKELGIDPDLMMSHMFIESHMNRTASSGRGAVGVAQIIHSTTYTLMNDQIYGPIVARIAERARQSGKWSGQLKRVSWTIPTRGSGNIYDWNDPGLRCAAIFANAALLKGTFNYDSTGTRTQNGAAIDLAASAVAYNAGPGRADKLNGNGYRGFPGSTGDSAWFLALPEETKGHVIKLVIAYRAIQEWRRRASQTTPAANNTDTNNSTTTANTSGTSTTGGKTAVSQSPPRNKPMLLMNFTPDLSSSSLNYANRGSRDIRLREDIISDIQSIKNILNYYDIPLSLIGQDINLRNKFISKFAMVGLEVALNKFCGLNEYLDLEKDDYYTGPDQSYLKNDKFKLKIYGNVRKKIIKEHEKYKIINKPVEVYDLKETLNKSEPKIVKIFKPIIDITEIFENHGFIDVKPQKDFFTNSIIKESYWNLFYKPSKIMIGDTYRSVLLTVHKETNDPIWRFSNLKWDGEDFK